MSGFEPKWTLAHKFYADFNATASELTFRLDALKNGTDVAPATIQAAASDLSRLAKSLTDASGSLPSYDQRQCELQLKTLEKSMEDFRAASTAAPTFSFRRKPTKPKPSAEHESAVGSTLTKPQSTMLEYREALVGFSHRYLTILDVRCPNPSAEVSISDLDNCIVNLLPDDDDQTKITAFHIQRVSGSVILLPQISGSIILHGLSNCLIASGCHQFRMHDSTAVDVYLECISDPVIEHCSRIRFAPYPHGLVRRKSIQISNHLAVMDFSHILPTPSPNWRVLLEEEWEKSWPVLALHGQALREELERMLLAYSQIPANDSRT